MSFSEITFVSLFEKIGFRVVKMDASYKIRSYNSKPVINIEYRNAMSSSVLKLFFNYEKSYINMDGIYKNGNIFIYDFFYENVKINNIKFNSIYSKRKLSHFNIKCVYSEVVHNGITFKAKYIKRSYKNKIRNVFWTNNGIYYHTMKVVFSIEKKKELVVEEFDKKYLSFKFEYKLPYKKMYNLHSSYADISFKIKNLRINTNDYVYNKNIPLLFKKSINTKSVGNMLKMSINNYIHLFGIYSPYQTYKYAILISLTGYELGMNFSLVNTPLRDFYSHQAVLRVNMHRMKWREPIGDIIDIPLNVKQYKFKSSCMVSIFPNVWKDCKTKYPDGFIFPPLRDYKYVTNKKLLSCFKIEQKKYYKKVISNVKSGTFNYLNKIDKYKGTSASFLSLFYLFYSRKYHLFNFGYLFVLSQTSGVSIGYLLKKETDIYNIYYKVNNYSYKNIFKLIHNMVVPYCNVGSSKCNFVVNFYLDELNDLTTNVPIGYHRYFLSNKNIYNTYVAKQTRNKDLKQIKSNQMKINISTQQNLSSIYSFGQSFTLNKNTNLLSLVKSFVKVILPIRLKKWYSDTYYIPYNYKININGKYNQWDLSIHSSNLECYYGPIMEVNHKWY